jgi:hypothetical protein
MKREPIEWHLVPEKQLPMHDRLLNWARWCRGPAGSDVSPMFRLYSATDANQGDGQRYGLMATAKVVDARDATKIARGVGMLPEPHRLALQWYYVRPVSPARACQAIATTMAGLARLVNDGRLMLLNRRV